MVKRICIFVETKDVTITPGSRPVWAANTSPYEIEDLVTITTKKEIKTLEITDEVFKQLELITKEAMQDEIDKAEEDSDDQKAQDSQAPA